jgi:hypothetical protein
MLTNGYLQILWVISCSVKQLSLKLTQRRGQCVGRLCRLKATARRKDAKGLQSFDDKSLGGLDINSPTKVWKGCVVSASLKTGLTTDEC